MKKRRRQVNKPWTEQEDAKLKALHSKLGNKWKRISATIGRSVGEVKSRSSKICVQRIKNHPLTAPYSREGIPSSQENTTSFNSANKIRCADFSSKPSLLEAFSTSSNTTTTESTKFVNLLPGFSAESRHVNTTCLVPFSPLLRSSRNTKVAATSGTTPFHRPIPPSKRLSNGQHLPSTTVPTSIEDVTPATLELGSFQFDNGSAVTKIRCANSSPKVSCSVQKRKIPTYESPFPHIDLFFDQFENRGPPIGIMNDKPLRSPLHYALFTPETLQLWRKWTKRALVWNVQLPKNITKFGQIAYWRGHIGPV